MQLRWLLSAITALLLGLALWQIRAGSDRPDRSADRRSPERPVDVRNPRNGDTPAPDAAQPETGDREPNAEPSEEVREDIYELTLQGEADYERRKRDRLVNRWRNGEWAEKLAAAKGESDARFRRGNVFALIEHPGRFSLLMPEEELAPGGWGQFYTSVLTAFHDANVATEDKWRAGKAFLLGLGLETKQDVARIRDLAELHLQVDLYGRSTVEAREVARLLGAEFTKAQAARVAVALRGLATGQWRVTELRAWHGETDLTPRERGLVANALANATARKRRALEQVLLPEQFSKLYDRLRYDGDEYGRKRFGREAR